MPEYIVTAPDGLEYEVTAPEGASEQEILSYAQKNYAQQSGVQPRPERPFIQKMVEEVVEPTATIASGMIAEPVAGLAGLVSLASRGDSEAATKAIESTRESLTYVPRSEAGIKTLQDVGEFMSPVAEGIESLGRAGYEAGGPVLGAAAKTAPTAALSALSFAPVRQATGIPSMVRGIKNLATPSAKAILKKAAPTVDGLKSAAREVYKQIDDTGTVINPRSVTRLSKTLTGLANKEGFNRRMHPKVSAALDEFDLIKDTRQTVTGIDTLRKLTKDAAASIDKGEARLGKMLIDQIDDFMDNLNQGDFYGRGKNVGPMYRDARQLWHRASKADLLDDAFERARNQASGFENGIRTQFRSILNNKRKLRGFSPDEVEAMRLVVRGAPAENIAKALGKFGFSEGQATGMLLGSLGVAGGAAAFGAPGAVAVPLIGQVSKTLAQKLTRNNAIMANAVVRAGKNGMGVVKAYMKNTRPADRNTAELTELLLRPQISLKALKSNISKLPVPDRKIAKDAVFFASFLQSQQEQNVPLPQNNRL